MFTRIHQISLSLLIFIFNFPALAIAPLSDEKACEWALSDNLFLSQYEIERLKLKLGWMPEAVRQQRLTDFMIEKLRLQTKEMPSAQVTFMAPPDFVPGTSSPRTLVLKAFLVEKNDVRWNAKIGTKVWVVDINGKWQTAQQGDLLLVHGESLRVVALISNYQSSPQMTLFAKSEVF